MRKIIKLKSGEMAIVSENAAIKAATTADEALLEKLEDNGDLEYVEILEKEEEILIITYPDTLNSLALTVFTNRSGEKSFNIQRTESNVEFLRTALQALEQNNEIFSCHIQHREQKQ